MKNKVFIIILKEDIPDSIYLDMLAQIKEDYKEKIKEILTTGIYQ